MLLGVSASHRPHASELLLTYAGPHAASTLLRPGMCRLVMVSSGDGREWGGERTVALLVLDGRLL